ncbi:MAG: endonuclease mitochondrial [Bradyrhizobium sp.]|jgi:endonuclease G|nr:endonuclease mitochondrial [Bradyrhizobium sp.]
MLKRILIPVTLAVAVIAAPVDGRRTAATSHASAATKKTKTTPPPAPPAAVVTHPRTVCTEDYFSGQAPAAVAPSVPTGQIFCHMIYSVSYAVSILNPLWSAEHLTQAAAIGGDATFRVERSTFLRQPELTADQQAKNGEFAHNEWDLGHMTPANDAPDDPSQNDTFFLTNVVPQEGQLNRFLWARLEASVHKLAEDDGEVYIVTGPIFGPHPPLMASRVPIPDYTFKAIYLPSRSLAIAFVGLNNPTATCTAVSVAEITRRTGIDPFPALSPSVKATLPSFTLPDGVNVKKNGSRQRVPAPHCPPARP